jgi:hypothetical protein
MIDKPISSTVPLRPDDARFDLFPSWSVSEVFCEKVCGQSFDMPGVPAQFATTASET